MFKDEPQNWSKIFNISVIVTTMLLVDFMLVTSGGLLIFRKDFIAIYLIYIVNNSKRFYHVRS
jgi:hypothetical protein